MPESWESTSAVALDVTFSPCSGLLATLTLFVSFPETELSIFAVIVNVFVALTAREPRSDQETVWPTFVPAGSDDET